MEAAKAALQRREEDRTLQRAQKIRHMHGTMNAAMQKPYEPPPSSLPGWDFLLKEARWMCVDFMQERRFKATLAAQLAHLCAKAVSSGPQLRALKERERGEHRMKQRRAALKLVGAVKGKSDAPAWPRAVPRPKSLPVEAPPTPPAVGESCLLVYEAEEDLVEVLLKDLESLERRRQTEFEDRNRDYEIELESARRVVGAHKAKEAERLLRVEQAEMGIESDGFRGRKQGKVRLPMKRAAVPKAAADRAVRARVGEEMDVDVDAVGRPGRRSQPRIAPPAAAGAQAARMEARQRQAADRRKELQARQQAMLRMAPWSKAEENLFLCIIHEFGLNWALVGDVLSACNSMQGLHRRPDVCKQKFRLMSQEITAARPGEHVTLDAVMSSRGVTRGNSRDVLAASVPVPDVTLKRHLGAMLEIGKRLMQQRNIQRPSREELSRLTQAGSHASHLQLQQQISASRGGGLIVDPVGLIKAQKKAAQAQALAGQPQQASAQGAPGAQQGATPAVGGPGGTAAPGDVSLPSGGLQLPPMSVPPITLPPAISLPGGTSGLPGLPPPNMLPGMPPGGLPGQNGMPSLGSFPPGGLPPLVGMPGQPSVSMPPIQPSAGMQPPGDGMG